jgi:hypothetical protein
MRRIRSKLTADLVIGMVQGGGSHRGGGGPGEKKKRFVPQKEYHTSSLHNSLHSHLGEARLTFFSLCLSRRETLRSDIQ